MRLKKEKPKRKKLGNLTVVADKVNIVTPGGKPLQVSGTGLGGVRAPKRQYQFSFDQAPSTSVTGKEDVLQPPTIPLPQQPQASAVTNSLGRIGRLLGEMALNYAGQALFNQAGTAMENWMYNTESSANVPEVPDSLVPPTIGQTLNQGGTAAWASTQPTGIGGSPADITYSNPTTWTGTFHTLTPNTPTRPMPSPINTNVNRIVGPDSAGLTPTAATTPYSAGLTPSTPTGPSSTPVTPTAPIFSPNLLPSPINTNVGPDSAGLTPTAATTPYSAGLTPSTPTSAMVTPPYSGPNLAQRVPGGWPDAMSPDGQTPIPRPLMTEINLATPQIQTIPTQEAVPGVYEPPAIDLLGLNPAWRQFVEDMSTRDETGLVRYVNYPEFGGREESSALVRGYEALDNQLYNQIHNLVRQRRVARRPIDPELIQQFRLDLARNEAVSELDRQGAPMTGVRPGPLSFTEEMIPRTDPTMLNRRVRPEPLNLTGMHSGYDPNLLEHRQPINPRGLRYRANVIPSRRSARNR